MDGEGLTLEQLAVRNWRYDEARRAGLSPVEAALFAESDRDLGERASAILAPISLAWSWAISRKLEKLRVFVAAGFIAAPFCT